MAENFSSGRRERPRTAFRRRFLATWFNRRNLPYFVLLVLLAFLATTEYYERRQDRPVTLPAEAGKETPPPSWPMNLTQAPDQVEVAWQEMTDGDRREVPSPTTPVDPTRFVLPFHGELRQGLGWRYDEKLNAWVYHRGADFAVRSQEAVVAVAAGEVVEVKPGEEGGLAVTVDHGEGWRSFYERLGRVVVTPGTRIGAGEPIGYPGDGVVHFAVERGGAPLDPVGLFPGLG